MSVSLPEYSVDVVEAGRPARRHRIRSAIDEHLRFETKALAAYCLARWDATVYDAFVVAAAVQFCDQVIRRPSTTPLPRPPPPRPEQRRPRHPLRPPPSSSVAPAEAGASQPFPWPCR